MGLTLQDIEAIVNLLKTKVVNHLVKNEEKDKNPGQLTKSQLAIKFKRRSENFFGVLC